LGDKVIHPNQDGGCRKKPKNPTDLRQSSLPPSSKKVLFCWRPILYFGGITPPILVCKKKLTPP
uniref:hypothetical protein n=1 Tax=Algoriphagus sp. TaxID=1872435 RepID=UPI0040470863